MIEGRDLDPVPGALERALAGAEEDPQPLLLFDTWERMAAADGFLRGRLLPHLPERTVAVIASRTPPAGEWFQAGWEQVVLELALKPLPLPDAKALCRARRGGPPPRRPRRALGPGARRSRSPLGADAARVDPELDPGRIERDPDLVGALLLARRFAEGVGARHEPALDAEAGGRVLECHVLDHGPGGLAGQVRAQVHREAGAAASAPARDHATADDVREALRHARRPAALAASPLASGGEPGERAASVRALLDRAVAEAFATGPKEDLLRRVLRRGYLDEDANHERAMRDCHVSRATYFRRLREASDRVAAWVAGEDPRRAASGPTAGLAEDS